MSSSAWASTFATKCTRESLVTVRRECRLDEARTEVRAADADVDDVGDRATVVAGPRAAAHVADEGRHVVEDRVDVRHDVVAVDADHGVARRPQRDVQHRAMLGRVDLVAGEHRVAPGFDAGPAREREQRGERRVVDPVLRRVEREPGRLERRASTAGRRRMRTARGSGRRRRRRGRGRSRTGAGRSSVLDRWWFECGERRAHPRARIVDRMLRRRRRFVGSPIVPARAPPYRRRVDRLSGARDEARRFVSLRRRPLHARIGVCLSIPALSLLDLPQDRRVGRLRASTSAATRRR